MDKLREVSVIGALGKMGRGISLLILLEQAWLGLKEKKGSYSLHLIDPNLLEARKVREMFRKELRRSAEKRIIELREAYKDHPHLVSNKEMIEAFIEKAMDGVEISSEIAAAKTSSLIFEAAFESVEFKIRLFDYLREHSLKSAWFFTNTSSIPIHVMNEKSHLDGRIIGFHFYNPPTVQRLMEIIPLKQGHSELKETALELAKRFKKTTIVSHDVAGFIGNGYFFREIRLAFELVNKLKAKEGEERALVAIDRLTREWLVRPMGIFQLLDFVGLDVCLNIAKVMNEFSSEKYEFPLLKAWCARKLYGGSTPEGSPKAGLFDYEGPRPSKIFSLSENSYIPLPETDFLSARTSAINWKELHKNPQKNEVITAYFETLFREESVGASLAKYWLEKGFDFMNDLVQTGVANDRKDVSEVLKLGFYHIYTPNEVMDVYKAFS